MIAAVLTIPSLGVVASWHFGHRLLAVSLATSIFAVLLTTLVVGNSGDSSSAPAPLPTGCEDAIGDLGSDVTFVPPATMTVGTPITVHATVTLTTSTPLDDLATNDPCMIGARLNAGRQFFSIDPDDEDRQTFAAGSAAGIHLDWMWSVTALKQGETLSLVLTTYDTDGRPQTERHYPDITPPIAIDTPDTRNSWRKVNDFADEPVPKLLLGVLFSGISAATIWLCGKKVVSRWRRRRDRDRYEAVL